MINIQEVFHSVEGEGIRIGQPTTFIRVQGCPYSCPFCDTKYAQKVDEENPNAATVDQMVEIIKSYGHLGHHVEFTGGDPSLYKEDLLEVIKRFEPDWSFTIQAIGDEDLNDFFIDERYRVRFAYDMKDDRMTSIPFKVHPLNLRETDEVKIIVDYDNYAYMRNRVIDYLQNTPVPIIISAISGKNTVTLEEEIAQWKWVTEKVLSDTCWPFEIRNRLHVLPRLQQLYWRYERGR